MKKQKIKRELTVPVYGMQARQQLPGDSPLMFGLFQEQGRHVAICSRDHHLLSLSPTPRGPLRSSALDVAAHLCHHLTLHRGIHPPLPVPSWESRL
jgi:hypothetical protein